MYADRKSRLIAAGCPPFVTASAYGPCRPRRIASVWACPLNRYAVMLVVVPVSLTSMSRKNGPPEAISWVPGRMNTPCALPLAPNGFCAISRCEL